MGARCCILTPGGPGAVAGVLLCADTALELEAILRSGLGGPVAVGAVSKRGLFGVDEGVVARWSEDSAELMPHGGQAVMRGLMRALAAAGVTPVPSETIDPEERFPEATSRVEALMLATMARARSPRAVDVLLRQPERWSRGEPEMPAETQAQLRRLVEPALVVALGPANVGKSTLANALAGRAVSVVADEPGTTRDHVGVMLELGGLVVRYVDTPGVRTEACGPEREALATALELARRADLLLMCGDRATPPIDPAALGLEGKPSLRVGLRGDLGHPAWGAEIVTSAVEGGGVAELGGIIAGRLTPSEADSAAGCWRFWE